MEETKRITGIFIHYDNGDSVDIRNLSEKEYMDFLEMTFKIRLALIAMSEKRG